MDKHNIFRWYARYFAKKKFYKWNLFLFHLSVRGMGVLNYYNFNLSGESFFIDTFLKRFDLKTVFDVGANEGEYTKRIRESHPDCKIHCFEPNPETFDLLQKKYSNATGVFLHNIGLSNIVESVEIYDTEQNDGSRLATVYKEVIQGIFQRNLKSHTINLEVLDQFVEKHSIKNIDLLKIDTEGHEFSVLTGARNTLKKGSISIIHIEFNLMNVFSRVFLKDFIDLIGENYNLYRLLPKELIPIDYSRPLVNELFAFQNIIAVRKDIDNN